MLWLLRCKERLCSIFVFLVLISTACAIQAKPIKAYTELFFPYQLLDEQGEISGYSVEVAQALAAKVGDSLDINMLPWTTAYNLAQTEPNTMIFSIRRTDEREQSFEWVGQIATERLYFWRLTNSDIPAFDHYSPYRRYRFAIVKDAITHQFLQKANFPNLCLMSETGSNEDERQRIRMLVNNRADLMIASRRAINWALDRLGYEQDMLTPIYRATPLEGALYIAFSKRTDKAVIEKYREALIELMASEQAAEMKQRWKIDD